jgi:hypothetical protein
VDSDTGYLRLLRSPDEWPYEQTQNKNDREPDPPHGAASVEDGWRESS